MAALFYCFRGCACYIGDFYEKTVTHTSSHELNSEDDAIKPLTAVEKNIVQIAKGITQDVAPEN